MSRRKRIHNDNRSLEPGKPLNAAQKAICRVYGGGDYAHIATADDPWPLIHTAGDTLFVFLMIELSSNECCDTVEEAHSRVDNAINDLNVVANELAMMGPPVADIFEALDAARVMFGNNGDHDLARDCASGMAAIRRKTFLVIPAFDWGGDERQAFYSANSAEDAARQAYIEICEPYDEKGLEMIAVPQARETGDRTWAVWELPVCPPIGGIDWSSMPRTDYVPCEANTAN